MRILITGGNGQLGRTLAPVLHVHGHNVTIVDRSAIQSAYPTIITDIRNPDAMRRAVDGHDVVIHAAALHGTHIGTVSERDFIDVGVLGTHNILAAARAAHVKQVIYISSTSVYGISSTQPRSTSIYVDEDTPVRPIDINDMCKVMGEQLCHHYRQNYQLNTSILRVGRFFQDDWVTFNLRKLSGGVDIRDVAQAVLLAVEAQSKSDATFCVAAQTAFTQADIPYLADHADDVIEQRYPGARAALARLGHRLPKTVHRVVSIARASQQLHYRPKENFAEFLERLKPPSTGAQLSLLGLTNNHVSLY
jgi:UDP-glucose 4-epimerase